MHANRESRPDNAMDNEEFSADGSREPGLTGPDCILTICAIARPIMHEHETKSSIGAVPA